MTHFRRIVLLMAAICCLTGSVCAQGDRGFDTNYLLGDSFVYFGISPSRMSSHLPADALALKREFPPLAAAGLQLKSIESYALQAASSEDPATFDDKVLIALRTSNPFTPRAFAESMGTADEEVEYKGRPRFKSGWEGMPDVYFPSDQTMLMAMSDRLEAAVDSPMSMSPLVSKLRTISPSAEAVALVDFSIGERESFLGLMRESMLPMDESFIEKVNQTRSITAVIDLAQDQPISITAVMDSEEAAKQTEAIVQPWLAKAKELIANARTITVPQESKASYDRLMQALTEAVDNVEMTSEGNEFRFVVDKEGGLPELAEVMNLVYSWMAVNEEVDPVPIEAIEIK